MITKAITSFQTLIVPLRSTSQLEFENKNVNLEED